jgi:hypothetical protein
MWFRGERETWQCDPTDQRPSTRQGGSSTGQQGPHDSEASNTTAREQALWKWGLHGGEVDDRGAPAVGATQLGRAHGEKWNRAGLGMEMSQPRRNNPYMHLHFLFLL